MKQHTAAASRSGIRVLYENPVAGLLREGDGSVKGVVYRSADGDRHSVRAGAVVLAASRRTPRCASGIWGRNGGKPRYTEPPVTPVRCWGWRWRAEPNGTGSGAGAMLSRRTLPHLRMGTGS